MTATLHKLTAGDGYTYLIRQVAAHDATERGRDTLSEYYSAKGESPGRWVGSGLESLSNTQAREVPPHVKDEVWTVAAGSEVTEDQMKALFGEGLHPNANAIATYVMGRGAPANVAIHAARLGNPFTIRSGETDFQKALAVAYREHNTAWAKRGMHRSTTTHVHASGPPSRARALTPNTADSPPTIANCPGSSRATPASAPPRSPDMTSPSHR